MLQMHVYREVSTLEPKVMWGLSWRQILASALLLVLGGGAWFLFYFVLGAEDLGMYAVCLLCMPVAAFGWWRPAGLKPEKYARFVLRHTAGQTVYLLDGRPVRSGVAVKPSFDERKFK